MINGPDQEDNVDGRKEEQGQLKRPWTTDILTHKLMETLSISSSTAALFFTLKKARNAQNGRGMMQLKLCGPNTDPNAPAMMDAALADFLHSHCLPFSLAEDPKLLGMIRVARLLGPNYKPPRRELIGGEYLDAIYMESWKEQMTSLLSEAKIFGVTVFGDGATIKSIPLVNVLAAGVNNPFALLDIADCTNHLAKGGKKDGRHIANIGMPIIKQMEPELNVHKKKCP